MKEHHQYPMWDASLSLEERLDDLIARLTTEEKIRLIPTREATVPRLGIPAYNVGGEVKPRGCMERGGNGISTTARSIKYLEYETYAGDWFSHWR